MKIILFKKPEKRYIVIAIAIIAILILTYIGLTKAKQNQPAEPAPSPVITPSPKPFETEKPQKKEYIKWVDFNIPYEILEAALQEDISTYNTDNHIEWITILSYLGAKCGGQYNKIGIKDIYAFTERLKSGEPLEEITKDMKYFKYYTEAYDAVLGEFVGEYSINMDGEWKNTYGLKVFSPIAEGYDYSHYDDFGANRSYGYKRKHLGHDMMGSIGTPIVAVESGYVETVGWNQYGGWRIGIRSFDKKRYYYYAHLRKDHPYHKDLKEGNIVKAGDVIGYLGMTGYSVKENVNNIDTPHLHFGMQLIFDESQKEGTNQIWINLYDITTLLQKHKVTVYKNEDEKEYYRKYDFKEELLEFTKN